jgi:hypothetical protein
MKRIHLKLALLATAWIWSAIETMYFLHTQGWHWGPNTISEKICDGIGVLIIVIAVIIPFEKKQ